MIAPTSMRAAATCALLATTCLSTFLASPALAQNADIPSAYKNIDENGVDLTDGSFNFSLVEGSIGSGEGLLSLIRYDAGGSSLDNWEGLSLRIEGATATVLLGDRSESFTANEAGFSADQANGATLIGSGSYYRYRNARGTEIVFASPTGSPTPDQVGFCDTSADTPCDLAARSIVEPNGKRVTLTWEVEAGGRRLLEVSNNLGYAMGVAYRPGGMVDGQITDAWFDRASVTFRNSMMPGSATPTVTYASPAPGVTEVTDTGGRTWRITTDGQNRIIGIKRPGAASDSTQVAYGENGVSQVTHEGITTSYARTLISTGSFTVISDALGTRRTVVSNLASGRPTQVNDAFGFGTLYLYDANDRLTETTAPEGNKRIITYDARGNVVRSVARAKPPADGSAPLPDIATEAGYDATCTNAAVCNQPRWTQDASGARTSYTYNDAGDVTSVLAPAPIAGSVRPETRYSYTSLTAPVSGRVTMLTGISACQTSSSCAGSADEVRTTVQYITANLQPTVIETGAGDGSLTASTAMAYDEIGNLTRVDGPLTDAADLTHAFYNASREIVSTIGADPDGTGPLKHRAQLLIRNADGDIVETYTGTAAGQTRADLDTMSALEAVHTGYDNRRVVYQSRDEGSVVTSVAQIAYDARGRVSCVTQRMDPAKYRGALPNACELQLPPGPHGYDRRTVNSYDAADRLIERATASGLPEEAREVTAAYTPNGQIATLIDANGNKTSYAYDGHDRVSRTSYPAQAAGAGTSNPDDYEQLTYDARSLVVSQRLRDGKTIGLTYDALGRLTGKDVPNLAFFEADSAYKYDNLGRLTEAAYVGSFGIGFTYDALGRKTAEANGAFGTTRSEYDLAGRRTRLIWSDGFAVDYRYLVTGEMADISEATGASLARFAYDDRGRRILLARGNGTTTTYAYDLGSRLQTLGHDFAGTATDLTSTFAYNPASQIVANDRSNDAYGITGGAADQTDSSVNGLNQLLGVGGRAVVHDARGNLTSDGVRTFGYTSENRLTSALPAPGAPRADLAYDPLGRLFHIASSATDFRHDGAQVIEETESYTGAGRSRFVHGPGVDEPLVVYDGAGRRWFHADERGSIIAVSDGTGNASFINAYDEYGTPAPGNSGRFGYTGQMWLPEAGVYSYKARMYDPGLGRFLQSDPIGYADGMNLYAYVGGDPVNFTDPSGTEIVIRGKHLPWCERARNIGICEALRDVANSVSGENDDGGGGGVGGGPAGPAVTQPLVIRASVSRQKRCPGNAGSSARFMSRTTNTAFRSIPGGGRSSPLSSEFSRVTQVPNFSSGGWQRVSSSHSQRSYEHSLPGSDRVVKVYIGDRNFDGANTATITSPTSSIEHYLEFIPYVFGRPVNTGNANDYLKDKAGC